MQCLPAGPGKCYFRHKENNNVSFKGADGRAWSLKFSVGAPPRYLVRICSGWKFFCQENHLEEGDICVFELISSKELAFKVAIFRMTGEKVDDNEPFGTLNVAPLRGMRTPARETTRKRHEKRGLMLMAGRLPSI